MKCNGVWHLKKKLSPLTRHYNDQIHTERDQGALHLGRNRPAHSAECDKLGSFGKPEDNSTNRTHARTAQAASSGTEARGCAAMMANRALGTTPFL